MTTPFIGEIQIFGFDFPPYGWAIANGATIPVSQNSTLFSLIGTTYGGNGQSTFQLPNLAARVAIGQGQGPGLQDRVIGETLGESFVPLMQSEMPLHNHNLQAYPQQPTDTTPRQGSGLGVPRSARLYSPLPSPNTTLSPNALSISGQGQPHENRQPCLALNFCIALYGDYPQFP